MGRLVLIGGRKKGAEMAHSHQANARIGKEAGERVEFYLMPGVLGNIRNIRLHRSLKSYLSLQTLLMNIPETSGE